MASKTIYELTGEWLHGYDMANDEEIDAESWLDYMNDIEADLETKADNYAKLIKQLQGDASLIKAEADRLAARYKALNNKADALKKALEFSMVATGKTKFKTELFSFGIQKNPPTVLLNDDVDVYDVPDEFLTYDAPKVNKKAILEAINNGENFDWCHKEQGESLRIR